MKKFLKIAIAATVLGTTVATTAICLNTNVYASQEFEVEPALNYDASKSFDGYKVVKGFYKDDNKREFEMYYSDGFFKDNANTYNPHMATLAAELAHASTTYVKNGDYSQGALNLTEALDTIGFDTKYVSDSYKKEPEPDSIACVIAQKELPNDMKYKYAIDITIRSASYGAEWASNVKLGLEGEAQGFMEAANQVTYKYFKEYLDENEDVQKSLDKGEVALFVNGYSRGAATANLTAKRLVDDYQKSGNGIYAYCIEAPQGGIDGMEATDKDYKCIHNIINPNDMVCYVGPKLMGFKRYGVDHYIGSSTPLATNYRDSGIFFNTPTDNWVDLENYDKNKELAKKELVKMLKSENVAKEYYPYDVQYKQLDLRHFKIKDVKKGYTLNFINNFVNALMVSKGKITVDRKYYDENMQTPIYNIIATLFKNMDVVDVRNITNIEPLYNAFINVLQQFVVNVKVSGSTNNIFKTTWEFVTGSDDLKYSLDFTDCMKATIASALTTAIEGQPKIKDILDKEYPTKAKGALKDINTLIKNALRGGNGLDDLITFGYNAKGIIQNHTMLQAIAWLRLEDTWFNQQN